MYNLVLDKNFTRPLGKFSPGKKQNFGPGPVKNKISVPVPVLAGPRPLCSSLPIQFDIISMCQE